MASGGMLAGLGQGLLNTQNVLAQYLAAQAQRKGREQQQSQFDAGQAMQQKELDLTAAAQRQHVNEFGLQQMERDKKELDMENLLKDPSMGPYAARLRATGQMFMTPTEQNDLEMKKLQATQGFEHTENEANRRNQLTVAGLYGPRRPNPEEQFKDDLRNLVTRLSLADEEKVSPAQKMQALRQFMEMGTVLGGYKMDPQKTHNFLAPGVDPFVKGRFGGDYNKAIMGLQTDPVAYAQLLQQGVDPDQVLSAVQQAQSAHNAELAAAKQQENLAALAALRKGGRR